MNRPVMSKPGLYDPTSIMNSDVLSKCQREGWIKLAVYLLSFFYYLYGWVTPAIECNAYRMANCIIPLQNDRLPDRLISGRGNAAKGWLLINSRNVHRRPSPVLVVAV